MPIVTATDFLSLARNYAAEPDDWPFAPRFDPAKRWYGRLAVADDHEVWLLTWLPGQGTDLHDHGGSAGAFTVVSGEVVEQTVRGGELAATPYIAGDGRRFGAHHVHRIVNAGARPAVTVHAYGPALTAMTRYRLHDGRLSVESITTAGADW
ncbi:cysteine dioxygenase family protein [Dactylosporangium sp. NPDC051485]|uniref:cysteine dioxygenase n=1 Tax=Dactylosporangium sp. NPDC051485 TaxID=3154846 RepID=UPI0034314798